MTTESKNEDPYDAVLRDLRGKRDEIDKAINMIERVRALASGVAPPSTPLDDTKPQMQTDPQTGPGDFLGMTIVDATKKLLEVRRRHLTNPEIVSGLRAGGLVLRSADPANTIGSVLKRRQAEVGDVVRVSPGRGGKWGLTEWTPHLRKARNNAKETPEQKADEEKNEFL